MVIFSGYRLFEARSSQVHTNESVQIRFAFILNNNFCFIISNFFFYLAYLFFILVKWFKLKVCLYYI